MADITGILRATVAGFAVLVGIAVMGAAGVSGEFELLQISTVSNGFIIVLLGAVLFGQYRGDA